MDSNDFRNSKIKDIEEFFADNAFNSVKINNFKKMLKNQKVINFREIKGIKNFTNICDHLHFDQLRLIRAVKDEKNNEKFIFQTNDNNYIESVLMPDKKNISICISTQIGCKLGCIICNTGKIKFIRNLRIHEILDQIRQIYIERIYPDKLSCVSFMGMGEPFDNLENCMRVCEWLASDWGYFISYKKITFSTSGCLDFNKFLKYDKLPNLAVSLHSADPVKRRILLPSFVISLKKLKEYMLAYIEKFKKSISIEYCMINDFNDREEDAYLLIEYVKDIPCKINLLNYNITEFSDFLPVDQNKIIKFKNILKKNNIQTIYRKSLGININAGCGQLGRDQLLK